MNIESHDKTISQGVDEEIQNIINRKLDAIQFLDEFIHNWIDKGRDINIIKDDLEERKLRIKDLKAYCEDKGQNIDDYYKDK